MAKAFGKQKSSSAELQLRAVTQAVENSELPGEKSAHIGALASPVRTNVTLEDDFARILRKVAGTVDPALKLGF